MAEPHVSAAERKTALEAAEDLFERWRKERARLDWLDFWAHWKQEPVRIPRSATEEHKKLAELSNSPWLWLVVNSVAQGLRVDGYKSSHDANPGDENARPWELWLANRLDRRHGQINKAALAYGYAFGLALPGEDRDGPRSVLKPISPRWSYAVYQDPAWDEWPMYWLQVHEAPGRHFLLELYDEKFVHRIDMPTDGGDPEYIEPRIHGFYHPPVVQFGMPDIDGRCYGQVEPFIGMVKRLNKTTYDRLLVQHFESWKVRTAVGLEKPADPEKMQQFMMQLRHGDILVSDSPDTKFGALPETPLDGFIRAAQWDVETLASISQTPTYELTGQLVNLSADALVAARGGQMRKTSDWQQALGSQYAQWLRLGAYLEGNFEDAEDVHGRVTWQDMEVRSLSQAVDAYGKAAQMLGVPKQALWSRIPGVEQSDVEEWKQMAEDNALENFQAELERQTRDLLGNNQGGEAE